MQLRVIAGHLMGRFSRNVIFWVLITLILHSSSGIFFPNYVALLTVMVVSYAIPGYVNNLWLIPSFLMKRRYLVYISLFALLLALTVVGSYYETHWVNDLVPGLDYMGTSKDAALPVHAFPSMLMLTFLAFVNFMTDSIQNQSRLDQLEKQKLESELESLRSQVNPHFLFNALNTIYGMARRTDEETAKAVIMLSDILRHGLYDCNESRICMDKEILFLKQYVEFAQLRVHDKNSINLKVNADIQHQKIAPLLLVPFVENAIKHGLGNDNDAARIHIRLVLSENNLSFVCMNGHVAKPNDTKMVSNNGIGLKNVRRRLELLYPGRHNLRVTNDKEKFLVELNLNLA